MIQLKIVSNLLVMPESKLDTKRKWNLLCNKKLINFM